MNFTETEVRSLSARAQAHITELERKLAKARDTVTRVRSVPRRIDVSGEFIKPGDLDGVLDDPQFRPAPMRVWSAARALDDMRRERDEARDAGEALRDAYRHDRRNWHAEAFEQAVAIVHEQISGPDWDESETICLGTLEQEITIRIRALKGKTDE